MPTKRPSGCQSDSAKRPTEVSDEQEATGWARAIGRGLPAVSVPADMPQGARGVLSVLAGHVSWPQADIEDKTALGWLIAEGYAIFDRDGWCVLTPSGVALAKAVLGE
jgi:hypothetical protein